MVLSRKRASQDLAGEVKSGPDSEMNSGPNSELIKGGLYIRDKAGPSKSGPSYSPKIAKKIISKKYLDRRKTHIFRDGKTGVRGAIGDGLEVGGVEGCENGLAGNTVGSNSEKVRKELDSDYDKSYEYKSEAFNSLVSDDDEGKTVFDVFNEEIEYGKVKLVKRLLTQLDLKPKQAMEYMIEDYNVHFTGKMISRFKDEQRSPLPIMVP
ncbi:uncharacterized protein DS421_15g503950 [Arachis hypogaea]|nr:uncharacterized protein DS421_15g503950 [Arachis hypogaea]